MALAVPAYIPSPSINSFSLGPLVIHFYALMYLVGIAAAIVIPRRRWPAAGGDPEIVGDIGLGSVPAGIIGGRIYFDITTPMDIPHVWYGVFAVWDGGLGIWGGIALATVVGLWRLGPPGGHNALVIPLAGGIPDNYLNFSTFQPTFLYELIFDFAWAGVLVWLGHHGLRHRKIKP